jgi:hypothetical protein
MRTKKTVKYARMMRRSYRLNQTPHTGNLLIFQPSLGSSPICIPVITPEVKQKKKTQIHPVQIERENFCYFCVGTIRKICLSSADFYSDNSLMQGLIRVRVF